MSQPVEAMPIETPTPSVLPKPAVHSMEHVIPTRNQPALLGYYYSIFGLLPVIGLVLAPIAISYGLIGLDRGNRLPRNIGYGHALFATVAGIIGTVISYSLAVALGIILMVNYMSSTWPFPRDREPYEEPIEQLLQRVDLLEQHSKPQRGVPGRDLH